MNRRIARETPVVTYAIMAVCVLIPPLSMAEWIGGLDSLLSRLVFVPAYAFIEPHRIATAGFVHAGYIHLACNLLVLWLSGTQLERLIGRWRYAVFYLLTTISAYVFCLALATWTPLTSMSTVTVGASGAVFGLFAAHLIIQRHAGAETAGLAILLGLSLFDGFFDGGTSWEVHLGGILAGVAMTSGLVAVARMSRRNPAPTTTGGSQVALTRARRVGTLGCLGVFAATACVDIAIWAGCLASVTGR